ncbi:hypothetical protein [Vibrio diazotrophicus]|uniref:hypothetical protein n=1 Tax=Vibrio diazotrophicus TaxID=685 RepID=UPI00142D4C69|nr:hypothetical protein [Vibrio diazotrophicus]NIY94625.1 hypothetical protein [Vibrio diazotrophicus]
MNPAITFNEMRKQLGFQIKASKGKVILVGILFCPPRTKIAKEEILPALLDFHYSSADKTQFYLPGYYQVAEPSSSSIGALSHPEYPEFEYDSKKFYDFVKIMEEKCKWKYSGGTDLMIVNARLNSSSDEGYLDFASAIPLNLESVKQKANYLEIGMFFETIFNFSEEYIGKNPTSALSDEFGKSALRGAFKELAYRSIPKDTKGKVQEGLLFASSDLRKSKST